MSVKKDGAAKQKYQKPMLTHFGLVRELSQSGSGISSEGAADDKCNPNPNKHPNQNCGPAGGG
jgi:hypothetical protein